MPARDPDNGRVRELPPAKLVFCDKKGCGCHYLNQCPTHGPWPEEERTDKHWPVPDLAW